MKNKNQRYIDLSGNKYGRLTVIEYSHTENRLAMWKCKCDCGNEKIVSSVALRSGHCLSCGCLFKDTMQGSKFAYKHGESKSPLYILWSNMKARCNNSNSSDYGRYGAKGIKVCNEWANNYNTFKKWAISNGYNENLTIDRINNNGNYEPNNCRFVNRKIQANNTRNCVYYSYNGNQYTLSELSEIVDIPKGTLWNRINVLGWDFNKAITTPIRGN